MMEPAKDRMRNNVPEPPDVEQRGDIFRPGWGAATASGGHLEMFLSERNFRPTVRRGVFRPKSRVSPRCVTAGRTLERRHGLPGLHQHRVEVTAASALPSDLHRQLDDRGGDLRQCLNALCPEFRFGHGGLSAGGVEGLKLPKELRPTAITLDVLMPDLDGWSVLADLRQDPELAEIPVIMITIVDEHRRGIALGAAGYLTKPIDRERLRRVIGRFRAPARPTRVLVVEDDVIQRERMLGWLEGPQWTVREAENGREALKRIQQNKPDVILLDLMMPEMDGFAVVAALQKEAGWQDIPIIVITARELDAKDRERLNAGVQFVLVKERFRPADLVERIRWLVQTKPAVSNGMEAAS